MITTFIWAIWSFSGIFILGYSVYIKDDLLIVTSGVNVGLTITIIALKSWQATFENCLLRQIEEYDTEFDYEPGYDYTSNIDLLYHNPFSCRIRDRSIGQL